MIDVAVLLKQVDTRQVPTEWDRIELLLESARVFWEEHYTLVQIRQMLLAGNMQFWHLRRVDEDEPHLGALTQIDVYGLKKVLRIVWLGGEDFGEVMNFLWVLELWAANLGCSEIEVSGRDGFERMLKSYGFKKTHVVLRKQIAHISKQEH